MACAIHQDVLRLEIAVYDEVFVRVLHGGADLAEQVQAGAQVELVQVPGGVADCRAQGGRLLPWLAQARSQAG